MTDTTDREIVQTRLIDAPRALVFRAFTDPEHVGRWWGPRGFKTTTKRMEVKPGGVWENVMHGPDGTDYPNYIVFREVVAPERLCWDHGTAEGAPFEFSNTVTFEDVGGKTRLTMRALFPGAEVRRQVVEEHGAIEGGKQTIDRFVEHLATLEPKEGELLIRRVLKAPRALVWKAWTEAERLGQWWGPAGMKLTVEAFDLRPGGHFHYRMDAPDGFAMWGRFDYREVVPPERLVYVSGFADAEANIVQAPIAPEFPLQVLNVLRFEEADGRTTLTLHGVPLDATDAQRRFFEKLRGSMQAGFGSTFDALDAYLARTGS